MDNKEKKIRKPRKKRVSTVELIKLQEWERHFYQSQAISMSKTIQFGMLSQIMTFLMGAVLLYIQPRESFLAVMIFSIASVGISQFARGLFTVGKNKIGYILKIAAVLCLLSGIIAAVCGLIAFNNAFNN